MNIVFVARHHTAVIEIVSIIKAWQNNQSNLPDVAHGCDRDYAFRWTDMKVLCNQDPTVPDVTEAMAPALMFGIGDYEGDCPHI